MKKKVDDRIRTLVETGVRNHQRSFFVLVGDHGRDQVVNLHYMLSKADLKARPSVLWCYKKELGFSSHRKKRMRQIKKEIQRGLRDANKDDPFDLFISSTNIRYTYYAETHKILGNTYGMLVLQDFEALTPNLLARTVETVEGGGIVVLLLRTMKSLTQLYNMSMDVHSRFRTEAHQDVKARFNERFLLSLTTCGNCLVLDDELNILPISSKGRNIPNRAPPENDDADNNSELKELKLSLKESQPVGSLVGLAKTIDQAKALLTFVEAISEKTLRSTVTLTAGRGRGKSAASGLALAAAIAYGYSNIFVTSPSPENLNTLFQFCVKGFEELGYKEHLDYELIQSTNPDFNKAVVRINITREHRQTIQYIHPADSEKLGQAELVCIDEAAAIPLPLVKKLMKNYLVFMTSTINGYEGTGRSLSIKLIQQLREQTAGGSNNQSAGGRVLRELKLDEPIRYARGDPIEKWLNEMLCLDTPTHLLKSAAGSGCPHPSECDLFYVDRDSLFSYHKVSEAFLQRLFSLFVASHYKNSPNDLQLLADAPGHHVFVLLSPVKEGQTTLPEILCAVQVCLEGEISKTSVMNSLSRGSRPSGDLIPWTVSQQFQDNDFPGLSGARVVRIATHPDYQRMGYGARALSQLHKYYQGQLTLGDVKIPNGDDQTNGVDGGEGLHDENIRPKPKPKPLLVGLDSRPPESLHWIGTSYGLTQSLFDFWNRAGYQPVYIRQTKNELTGEHTCIMLQILSSEGMGVATDSKWLDMYCADFKKRCLNLLGYDFKDFSPSLVLSVLDYKSEGLNVMSKEDADRILSVYDLKRLDAYSRNLVDYHMILDLVPPVAKCLFMKQVDVSLSSVQSAILAAMGLQYKSVDQLEAELTLPATQLLALFNKAIRKIASFFNALAEKELGQSIPKETDMPDLTPLPETLAEEQREDSKKVLKALKRKRMSLDDDVNNTSTPKRLGKKTPTKDKSKTPKKDKSKTPKK